MADVESQKICGKAKPRITVPMAIDGLILTLVACFLILTELGLLPQVVKRGYYCNDQSIQHEYKGDTITTVTILLSGLVPVLLIWLTEAFLYTPSINCSKTEPGSRCRGALLEAWYWTKKYGRGLVTMLVIIGTIKIFLGELRPHFLYTCKPDVNCQGNEYITSYTCTNREESHYFVRDASKSFPSGHSAMSVFEAIFMIWYLEKRVPRLRSVLTVPLCQMVLMCWAVFCSLSRITDNRHHWWDVLAGSIAGALAAIITCLFACRNFDASKRKRKPSLCRDHDHKLITSNSTNTPGGTPLHKEEIILNNVIHA
ncbi:phospholipid phosphatase 1-like isoform X1 [Anopheles cruzii]|uniref:phospholipid phosphatase 1-like isoform X1 n=1 Tax=Anopheles cruzii TaxID=68878 RepID=UPI0022EC1AB5|nr:phospholipid phosphatase 1-like isoform X1 [Anopheles cruzii]